MKQGDSPDVSKLMELAVLLELVRDTLQGALINAFLWLPCVYCAYRLGGARANRSLFVAFLVLECLSIALYGRWVWFWTAFQT